MSFLFHLSFSIGFAMLPSFHFLSLFLLSPFLSSFLLAHHLSVILWNKWQHEEHLQESISYGLS